MKPSSAFQVTAEDVHALMAQRGHPISIDAAESLFARHIEPHAGPGGRIEAVAMEGEGIDEQTEFAQEDIACILAAAGELPTVSS